MKQPRKLRGKPIPKDDIVLPPKQDGVLTIEDLAREVGDYAQISYKDALKVVRVIFGSMIRELKQQKYVKIMGFGTWKTKTTKPHRIMNIWTKRVHTPVPRPRVKFETHKYLEWSVNPQRFK